MHVSSDDPYNTDSFRALSSGRALIYLQKQRHPLKLAIDMKKRNTAEFLCSVGATLDLVECGFDMLVENMEMMNENDKNLMMLIANVGQYQALLALKNG